MEIYRNSPIVVSGPSASGKTELINYVENKYPLFLEANGCTTRARRKDEVGHMDFITEYEFKKLILSDNFIEYCVYNNNYYGVLKSEFEKLKQYHLMFNVGYTSAQKIKEEYDDTFMIYLLPPNKEELKRRLGDRDNKRYEIGMEETIKNAFNYEYLLISQTNDLPSTADDFMDIVEQKSGAKQKKLILAKNRDFVNNFYK